MTNPDDLEELLKSVQQIDRTGADTRTVDMHVARLREKLKDAADKPFVAFNKARTDPVPGIGLGFYLSRQIARDLGGNLVYKPREGLSTFVLSLPA